MRKPTSTPTPRRRRKLTEAEREVLRDQMGAARKMNLASGDVIRTYEELMRAIAERRGGAG